MEHLSTPALQSPDHITTENECFRAEDGKQYDEFGISVDISGDGKTIAIGSYTNGASHGGAVYIYRNLNSQWYQEAKLVASSGHDGDRFGHSIAISNDGSTLVVGAFGDSDYGEHSGAAYIYRHHRGEWIEEAKLQAFDGKSCDTYGYSVAIAGDGDTIFVGSPGFDCESGAVYIYHNYQHSWRYQAQLIIKEPSYADRMAYSLASTNNGDTLIVGVYPNESKLNSDGRVLVYRRYENWELETVIASKTPKKRTGFGRSVAISNQGHIVAISAHQEQTFRGAVHIYADDGEKWIHQTTIQPETACLMDQFGYSVALSGHGDYLVVGSRLSHIKEVDSGSAYLFHKELENWKQIRHFGPSDGGYGDYFGTSIAVSNESFNIVVGSEWNREGQGAAYLFQSPD